MLTTGSRDARRRGGPQEDWPSAANRYDFIDRISEGTLFVAYRVRERSSDREVTLKALKAVFSHHPQFAPALIEGARAALDFLHPNLATMFEVGEEDQTVFVVEQLIGGQSLETRLKRGSWSDLDLHACAQDIVTGLAFLHERNVLHGDLRPRQILSDGSHWRITDYGMAQAYAAAGIAPLDIQQDAAFYNAPERTTGVAPTVASDLYAVGVILYRMLAGRVPFDGASPLAIATRHRAELPLLPSHFNPDCPPYLEKIALRLLAKKPAARYQSATSILGDLQRGLRGDLLESYPPDEDETPIVMPPAAAKPATQRAGTSYVSEPIAIEPRPQSVALTPAEVAATGPSALETKFNHGLENKKYRKREFLSALLAGFWVLLTGCLLVGVFFGASYFWNKDTPPEVIVPSYAGQNESDVEQAFGRVGLKLTVGREAYDTNHPEGTILGGDTPPGKRVREGHEVTVTVSRGEEPVPMPNFGELSLQRARQIIMDHGMRLGQIAYQYHDTVPAGYVCSQYPEANTQFKRSDPINLIVSRGPMPSSDVAANAATDDANAADATPDGGAPDGNVASGTAPDASKEVLISRAVRVSVAIPTDAKSTDVTIVVNDAQGEHTAFSSTQLPGDLIKQVVQVTRRQGTTATVRVYVGDTLLLEKHV